MRNTIWLLSSLLALSGCSSLQTPTSLDAPRVDYHQHLVSPAFAPIVQFPVVDGPAAVARLDAAGIERAVVLSMGYSFGDERKGLADPDRLTREENDWTSRQVAESRGRLIGFCSVNPLRPEAPGEIERCLKLPGMIGLKLHFGNSGVSLRDPAHAERIGEIFALAERLKAPVLVHMRARGGKDFGAADAQLFLDKVVSKAPNIEIVVAHFGASSPGYAAQNDEVMAVFGAAAERKDPRMRNLYFDLTSNLTPEIAPEDAALIARRIRQVGPNRVLFGSDMVAPTSRNLREEWALYRTKLGLTDTELHTIAGNRTGFTRQAPRAGGIS
jgi:predicted TIM-barrel fold metal-dependent hydrolase